MSKDDPDLIHTESTVSLGNLDPCVLIQWGESEGILSARDARTRALTIIQAAAIAETEAGIYQKLKPKESPVGFGKKPSKNEKMAVKILLLVREGRPELPKDIQPIYGYNTQQPLVELRWGSKQGQMTPDAARHHAQVLLEVAEAAEQDAFFYHFAEKINMDADIVQEFMREFTLFRQQKQLEDLLENSGSDKESL